MIDGVKIDRDFFGLESESKLLFQSGRDGGRSWVENRRFGAAFAGVGRLISAEEEIEVILTSHPRLIDDESVEPWAERLHGKGLQCAVPKLKFAKIAFSDLQNLAFWTARFVFAKLRSALVDEKDVA